MARRLIYRRARTDYPAGIMAIYDAGPKQWERYTVVYSPELGATSFEDNFGWAYITEDGEGSHAEGHHWERPMATWGGVKGAGKTIPFSALTIPAQRFVLDDLIPCCPSCGGDMGGDNHTVSCEDWELPYPWAVVDTREVPVGKPAPILRRFLTEAEAADYIATLPDYQTGCYGLDGPADAWVPDAVEYGFAPNLIEN